MGSRYQPIEKTGPFPVPPNLPDYDLIRAAFSWDTAENYLSGLPGGCWNIAHEAVDRHCRGERAEKVALRWLGRSGDRRDYTYAELSEATSRFASALRDLGVGKGDRVFTLAPRIPELYIATLGALKNGSVVAPLFSAFGPEPIQTRLEMGRGLALVTTESLFQRKVAPIREQLTMLRHVIVVGETDGDTISREQLLKAGDPDRPAQPMDPEDMALLHFTSGTTGTPKGAVHVHRAVLHHYVSALYALDLHPDDIYWCTADPGWVTGTSYGIVAPLAHGVTSVVDEGDCPTRP